MSLFDTIKYPITDILDPEQVDILPVDIIIPWLEESIEFLGVMYPVTQADLGSAASVIAFALINKADSLKAWQNQEIRDDHIRMWKYYLTMRLKQRIRDYGNE